MATALPGRLSGRRYRWLLTLLPLSLTLPALAQAQRWQPAEPEKPSLSITQTWGEPLATGGASPNDFLRGGELPMARQTMLWSQRQRWALGFGIEQRARLAELLHRPDAAALQDGGLLVGMALNTSDSTQLTLHMPVLNSAARQSNPYADPLAGNEQRQFRMGLVFRSGDKLQDLRRGLLMKVELSNQTTLAVKPRAGRIGLTLNKSW